MHRFEIDPQLPAGFDQIVSSPHQERAAVENERQLSQRPGDVGKPPLNFGDFFGDQSGVGAALMQLGQLLGDGELGEIEVRQPVCFFHRHNPAAPLPGTDA